MGLGWCEAFPRAELRGRCRAGAVLCFLGEEQPFPSLEGSPVSNSSLPREGCVYRLRKPVVRRTQPFQSDFSLAPGGSFSFC